MDIEWIESANKDREHLLEILTFEEYIKIFEQNPKRECRPTYLYLKEMFDHYGKTEDGCFNIFLEEHVDCSPVFGQKHVQQEIYQNLLNFTEEGLNNKFILLVGPNGSAKSSLVKKIMRGAEDYSKSDDGALYSFSWIFPIDSYIKGNLGLASNNPTTNLVSFAHLEDKDISAILTSDLKDSPLLLIPRKYRQELIDKTFEKDIEYLESIRKSYLYNSDISKRNRMIYDALLKSYKGDHKEVLKHIRVERFFISKRYSSAAVTIEPQMHVDANMQQITMDKRLASLPPSLQSLNLFTMGGEIVLANRGVLEFSDLLKRPLDAFKYLLMTMETQNINLRGILTQLDIFFIGSSNEVHLVAFKQHPDFNSFKGRINFIRVPYLVSYSDEAKIYGEQIKNLKEKTTFEPGAVEALCMFGVMTRIRPGQEKNYKDKKLGKLASSLTPIEKTLLFGKSLIPQRFNVEEKQIIKKSQEDIRSEYENEGLYEGKFGISPRIVKQIIYDLANQHHIVTFVEVIDYLTKFIERKNEFDFLNIPPQGEYNNPMRFIESLKEYTLNEFDDQVRDSLGLIDERSYEDYIERYIANINALLKREKIKNPVTGKFEESDKFFIKEFETNINLKENPDKFRSHMLSKLGAYALDNPGRKISYSEVFPNTIRSLQQSFRDEQKKKIKHVAKFLVLFVEELADAPTERKTTPAGALNDETRNMIQTIINNMRKKYNHSEQGALTLLQYLLKERY